MARFVELAKEGPLTEQDNRVYHGCVFQVMQIVIDGKPAYYLAGEYNAASNTWRHQDIPDSVWPNLRAILRTPTLLKDQPNV